MSEKNELVCVFPNESIFDASQRYKQAREKQRNKDKFFYPSRTDFLSVRNGLGVRKVRTICQTRTFYNCQTYFPNQITIYTFFSYPSGFLIPLPCAGSLLWLFQFSCKPYWLSMNHYRLIFTGSRAKNWKIVQIHLILCDFHELNTLRFKIISYFCSSIQQRVQRHIAQ